MEQKVLWFDRQFNFDHLKGTFPSIYERLAGLMVRLEHKLTSIPEAQLSVRLNQKWSIEEHIGHLLDLEDLWIARMNDFLTEAELLTEADLENTKTHEANHNNTVLAELLAALHSKRNRLLDTCRQLESLAESRTALHPRLLQPMRVIDLAYFVAEHDDHHLAAISEIHQQLS